MSSTVIFIGTPVKDSDSSKFVHLFAPRNLLFRIAASFVPPFKKYNRVYVDLLGPLLAFVTLTLFLIYGYSFKKHKISMGPSEAMLTFGTLMPLMCFALAKLGKSTINFYETISLIGYSLYGHLLTLFFSFLLFHETSNVCFFISLIIFGGSSSLRLILVFLRTIPIPVARLLVCTSISVVNILFLIYLHFGYMHRTFS